MHLVIVTGMSGSGKSAALNLLEDLDFYCIDNIPAAVLPAAIEEISQNLDQQASKKIAVGFDARNSREAFDELPEFVRKMRSDGAQCDILFLQTEDHVLLTRYRETRRRHPLSSETVSLRDAIKAEREVLSSMLDIADLTIDTSHTSIYELRDTVATRVANRVPRSMSILIESFGFKHGIPADSDFVFDLRCLPNPYWQPNLRNLDGRSEPVAGFLDEQDLVQEMYKDIHGFLAQWIPRYVGFNRNYLTIAIGCTGGQHRSVYMTEKLASSLKKTFGQVHIRHNELP
ncbi:MAG: RNase adapter RapZ [Pseudomonadota bacterium]